MSYSLDELEIIFKNHSKDFKEHLTRLKKQREENGLDTRNDDEKFCLPDAFLTIVQEIKKLRDK